MEETSANTANDSPATPKKKKSRTRRLLRWSFFIIVVLVAAVVVVAFQPNLIRSPLQQWLNSKNIAVTIVNLDSTINADEIRFTSQLSYEDKSNGININSAEISVESNWQRLFADTAKVDIAVNQVNADIQLNANSSTNNQADIIRQLFDFKSNQAAIDKLIEQIQTSKLAQLGQWSINDAKISLQGQTYTLNLIGEGNKQAQLSVDKASQKLLQLSFNLADKRLIANADSVLLSDYTDTNVTAQISKADLTIDLSDILQSQFSAVLRYDDIDTTLELLPANDSDGFVIHIDNKQLLSEPISVDLQANDGTLAVLFADLPLSILSQLKSFIPVESPYESVAGIANGNVVFDYNDNSFVNSTINLSDLGVTSQYINLSAIDADIVIDSAKVAATIRLNDSNVQLPALFHSDTKVVSGQGQVDYLFAEQKIEFSGVDIHSADYQSATAEGYVQIGDKVSLDIRGTGQGIDLSKTRDYLPYPIMTEELIDWLSAAFVKGTANDLTFAIGSADAENMFYHDSLKLDIRTQVVDTDFVFIEDNPVINVKSGSVSFQGKGLEIVSDEAFIGEIPLTSHASFVDLTEPVLQLKVTSEARSIEQILAVTEHSSIVKEAVEQTRAQLLLAGNAAFDLALTYDFMSETEDVAFELGVLASDADIALVAYPMLDISEANVDVRINNAGLQTVNAEAKFNNFQASIDIVNENGNLNGKLHSRQPVQELFQKLTFINKSMRDYILQEKVIAGMADLNVDFTLDSENNLTNIDIRSDLEGAKLNLFSAVEKPENEKLPLDFSYDLNQQQIRLALGDEFNLLADLNKQAFVIANSPIKTSNLPSKYIDMDIDFATLDLGKMIGFYQVLGEEELKTAETIATTEYKKFSGNINLSVANVNYKDIQIPDFKFAGVLNENYQISSSLFAISAQSLAEDLLVSVEFIDIGQVTKLMKSADVSKTEYSGEQVKTSDSTMHENLPPLTVNVKNIIINGETVATATLKSSTQDGRYSIDELYINGSDFIFELSAYEAIDMDSLVTKLQATFRANDVGKVLLAFGYDDVIDADSLDLQFNLTWPGGIDRLDLENSYGNASLNSENLQITDINTGVGNLLGLIDIVSIVKTIMLDVGQLVSAELSFSAVDGQWNIGGGRAQTKEFHANGSVVRLVASGGLDIHRKEYDFVKLLIIPKASNTLPIIGAVAGGVVGGIAALAIQQAFGDNIDRVVGIPYTLSGTWLAPQLTLGYKQNSKANNQPRDVFNERNFGDK